MGSKFHRVVLPEAMRTPSADEPAWHKALAVLEIDGRRGPIALPVTIAYQPGPGDSGKVLFREPVDFIAWGYGGMVRVVVFDPQTGEDVVSLDCGTCARGQIVTVEARR